MLRKGAVMVYDCFQAYEPGIIIIIIIIIINCEAPVIVYKYMALYTWFLIIIIIHRNITEDFTKCKSD